MDYEPCLPVVSILSPRAKRLSITMERLTEAWPDLRLLSPPVVFDETDYYEEEIGYPLLRWWGYRNQLADPSKLKMWKQESSKIEDELSDDQSDRTVNIDPGYLNYGLLVLGSFKYDLQKIYLGDGVYADPVLQFGEGEFHPFEWSFPDFQVSKYYPILSTMRNYYKKLRNQ